jgi:hypothetical protein
MPGWVRTTSLDHIEKPIFVIAIVSDGNPLRAGSR